MTAFKRIIAAMIVCALLLALSAPAWAESLTVYTGRSAKVYNSSGEAVGSLPANVKLTLKATKGSVCKVSYKGKTGFMKKSDLVKAAAEAETEPQSDVTPVNRTAYAARDGAKVYNKKGKAVGKVSANTEVTVTAVKGDVCQVKAGGKTRYMNKSDLSETRVEVTEAAPEPTAAPQSMNKTAYASKDGAKVYNKKGKTVGKLSLNTEVTVTAVSGNRCKVSVGGRIGYMKAADLSETKVEVPETASKTAYVNKDGAKVYNAKGKAVGSLKLNAEVTVTAVSGKLCRIKSGGKTGYMNADDLSSKKTEAPSDTTDTPTTAGEVSTVSSKSSAVPAKGTAKEMDWWTSGIQKIFPRGATATITDVDTGLAWREQRRGGTNHADVQPLTAADTAALRQAYGGTWSWNRRAIFVTINGENYAASMNGMPHGGGSITTNNFNGHHCVHFTNSRTHGSNKVCPLHQAAIKKAASTTLN